MGVVKDLTKAVQELNRKIDRLPVQGQLGRLPHPARKENIKKSYEKMEVEGAIIRKLSS